MYTSESHLAKQRAIAQPSEPFGFNNHQQARLRSQFPRSEIPSAAFLWTVSRDQSLLMRAAHQQFATAVLTLYVYASERFFFFFLQTSCSSL